MEYTPSPRPLFPGAPLSAELRFVEDAVSVSEHRDDRSHLHDCCEIYINIAGDVSFCIGSRIYPVFPGDVIITRPNERHHCVYHSDCRHVHYCLWIRDADSCHSLLSAFYERAEGEQNRIAMDDASRSLLISQMKAMQASEFAETGWLAAFFSVLDMLKCHRFDVGPAGRLPEDLRQVILYIDRNYSSDCSAGALEKQFFISRSTLCRHFRKHLGTSPSRYVEARRMAAARELLEQGESVQNVVIRCGFPDYSHFIAAFRRRFGITPYQYSRTRSSAP